MPFEWRDCILTMAVGQVVTTQTGLHLWSYTATSTKVTKEESREDAVRKHGLKVVSVEVWSLWIHSPMRSAIVWREIPQWIPSVVLSCEFSFRHWSDHHNGYTICSGCRLLTADPRQAVQQACPETLDEDAIDPHFCILFSSEDISADLQHFACQDVWCEDQRLVKNGSLRVRLLAQLIYMRFCFDFTLIQWWLIRSFLADHCHYAQWIRQIFFLKLRTTWPTWPCRWWKISMMQSRWDVNWRWQTKQLQKPENIEGLEGIFMHFSYDFFSFSCWPCWFLTWDTWVWLKSEPPNGWE